MPCYVCQYETQKYVTCFLLVNLLQVFDPLICSGRSPACRLEHSGFDVECHNCASGAGGNGHRERTIAAAELDRAVEVVESKLRQDAAGVEEPSPHLFIGHPALSHFHVKNMGWSLATLVAGHYTQALAVAGLYAKS